jgi:hypothetical protein
VKYKYLLRQLASLSENDVNAAIKAANSDRRYKLALAGIISVYLLGIVAFSLAITAFYKAFQPGILFKYIFAAAVIAAIFFSVVVLRLTVHRFFWRAVARHIDPSAHKPSL